MKTQKKTLNSCRCARLRARIQVIFSWQSLVCLISLSKCSKPYFHNSDWQICQWRNKETHLLNKRSASLIVTLHSYATCWDTELEGFYGKNQPRRVLNLKDVVTNSKPEHIDSGTASGFCIWAQIKTSFFLFLFLVYTSCLSFLK